MINNKFEDLFGQKARNPHKDLLTQFHMDIASSIQNVTEEIVLKLTMSLSKEYKSRNLCLAGGVALNCVANGKILKNNIYANTWKWQEFSFKENMLKTMNDLILALLDIKNDKFKFFTFEKK